jgi:hypothetical protein
MIASFLGCHVDRRFCRREWKSEVISKRLELSIPIPNRTLTFFYLHTSCCIYEQTWNTGDANPRSVEIKRLVRWRNYAVDIDSKLKIMRHANRTCHFITISLISWYKITLKKNRMHKHVFFSAAVYIWIYPSGLCPNRTGQSCLARRTGEDEGLSLKVSSRAPRDAVAPRSAARRRNCGRRGDSGRQPAQHTRARQREKGHTIPRDSLHP